MIAKPSAPKQNFNVTSGDLPLTPTTNALDRRSRLFVFLYQCRENLQADNAGTAFATVKRIQPLVQESVLFWLDKSGIGSVTRSRPAMYHPLFSLLAGLFAAFDFARKPFSKTSRMFFRAQA